jgi:hypothetical protein
MIRLYNLDSDRSLRSLNGKEKWQMENGKWVSISLRYTQPTKFDGSVLCPEAVLVTIPL